MKTFEYRLYPNKHQEQLLSACLENSRHLYNEMLEQVKAHYIETGKFLWKYSLCQRFKGRGGRHVPQTTVQCLAGRLDKALRHFCARKTLGQKVGFPRFKPATRWRSVHLRQWRRDVYLTEDGRLHIPKKLGSIIKIKMHRPLEGTPKTCHLVYRADGHWYALIVCDIPISKPTEDTRHDIGLDVGLINFIADSSGNTTQAPKFFRGTQRKLRIEQRTLARRKRESKRRDKTRQQIAKTHLKIKRQRRDWLHKIARRYADEYKYIFIEDLNIARMSRNHHFAKSITDAAWAEFFILLTEKAESAGGEVVKVPPQYTSQICSNCGRIVEKSLSVRTHVCPHCGYIDDRDVNAAKNILGRGTAIRTQRGSLERACSEKPHAQARGVATKPLASEPQ